MLFLSYATEDAEVARELGRALTDADLDPFLWEDHRGGLFMERLQDAIKRSDAFVALLSPHFIDSPWCRREQGMAIQREQELRARDESCVFVHVMEVGTTQPSAAGFLGGYDWVRLAGSKSRNEQIQELIDRLKSARPAEKTSTAASAGGLQASPLFRNRDDELSTVVRGLTNAGGPHFWLVIAPPQLGKTWFLEKVGEELTSRPQDDWVTTFVDLHRLRVGDRDDAGKVLARLFGRDDAMTITPETCLDIAQGIVRGKKSHLCLLDGAELLSHETARDLRDWMSEIYQLLEDSDVRLAFVVASRRDKEWRSVTPSPRLSMLPLTQFTDSVVRGVLRRLAQDTRQREPSPATYTRIVKSAHHLSEGVPALLVLCLQWIQAQQWLKPERLENPEVFEELAWPYLRTALLSRDSLLPRSPEQSKDARNALEQAFRILAPYRLFTQSHLRHHLEWDSLFEDALRAADWSIEDLWRAISDTALLTRPLDEAWQQIYPPIRRLLYRYFYKRSEDRAGANRDARGFIRVWAQKQNGKEQVIGLVEVLWHQVSDPQLRESGQFGTELTGSANELSLSLQPSDLYTVAELREYAVERMDNDDEFQSAISHVRGLYDRLIAVVRAPQES